MTQSSTVHWMIEVVHEVLGPDAQPLDLPPGATVSQIWHLASKASGLSAEQLAARVATHHQLELADSQAVTVQALQLLPERVARRHHVLPLRQTDRSFFVASADPMDDEAAEDVTFATGRLVIKIAPPSTSATASPWTISPSI